MPEGEEHAGIAYSEGGGGGKYTSQPVSNSASPLGQTQLFENKQSFQLCSLYLQKVKAT